MRRGGRPRTNTGRLGAGRGKVVGGGELGARRGGEPRPDGRLPASAGPPTSPPVRASLLAAAHDELDTVLAAAADSAAPPRTVDFFARSAAPPSLSPPQTSYFPATPPSSSSSAAPHPMATMQPMSSAAPRTGIYATRPDLLGDAVGYLLNEGCATPCNSVAQAFAQVVPPSARFQRALADLLPVLESDRAQLAQRILASYLLYALYAPHALEMNPFRDAMSAAYTRERTVAITPSADGTTGETRDQLVWVLWKILRGDGNDIGPYSPNTLARSPLPAKLKPANLFLDGDMLESSSGTSSLPQHAVGLPQPPVGTRPQLYPSPQPSAPVERDDEANAALAHAMSLLLAARDRTLTLSEQRALEPHISALAAPTGRIVTPLDFPPLIAHNKDTAFRLLVAILSASSSSPHSQSPSPSSSTLNMFRVAPGRPQLARSLSLDLSNTTPSFLNTLATLPPTLATFDLFGRLLREPTGLTIRLPSSFLSNADTPPGEEGVQRTTVADLVRTEVLGEFVHNAVQFLERAEVEEREGRVADDRFAQGVQNLCRFYRSLLKLHILDPVGQETVEMSHFALRYSRFEEARQLYAILVTGAPA